MPGSRVKTVDSDGIDSATATNGSIFQHNLFHIRAKTIFDDDAACSWPNHLDALSNVEMHGNRKMMMIILKNGVSDCYRDFNKPSPRVALRNNFSQATGHEKLVFSESGPEK